MKMSEVFELPMTNGNPNGKGMESYIGDCEYHIANFYDAENESWSEDAAIEMAKAAAHAINCHDELVEALEGAQKALSYCKGFMQIIPGVQEPDCTVLFQALIDNNAALTKAKGE